MIKELSDFEISQVSGALPSVPWYAHVGAAFMPGGTALLAGYSFVKLGWDSAHGRALNADS
ncbi:hypothetical protein [uncultured Brevundimonas sp.]|uniref:hypothetical protein n=1 Tax=uncultured Brevundimonas sp. TaxID=213418 RepID=UPI0025CFF799|nr:hypothetical protein [uncultured Brevundimonas sp.]